VPSGFEYRSLTGFTASQPMAARECAESRNFAESDYWKCDIKSVRKHNLPVPPGGGFAVTPVLRHFSFNHSLLKG
jgi:hypothetical protein